MWDRLWTTSQSDGQGAPISCSWSTPHHSWASRHPHAVSPTAHLGHTQHKPPTRDRMGGLVSGEPRRSKAYSASQARQTPGTFPPRDPGRPSRSSSRPPPYTRFGQCFQKRNCHFLEPGGAPTALALPIWCPSFPQRGPLPQAEPTMRVRLWRPYGGLPRAPYLPPGRSRVVGA